MKQKAFTLIELLVVIVIIGILATISTATFSGAREKAEIAKAVSSWQQVNSLMSEHVEDMYLRLDFEEGSGTLSSDSSGKNNDFIIGNSNLWSSETPLTNSKYSLASRSGSTSYTSYINQANTPSKDFTASMLVKVNRTDVYSDFFYHDWSPAPADFGWHLTQGSSLVNGTFQFSIGNYGGGGYSRVSGPALQAGKWYHIVATRNTSEGTMSLYINGELIGTQTDTMAHLNFDPTARLEIGGSPVSNDDFLIDNVVFWGKPYNPS